MRRTRPLLLAAIAFLGLTCTGIAGEDVSTVTVARLKDAAAEAVAFMHEHGF